MNGWLLCVTFFSAGSVVAQTHDSGLQSLLSQHWEKISSSGADTYAYNSQNVIYDRSGARIAVRTLTKLASGMERLHIDIGTLPCGKSTSIPSYFLQETGVDLIVHPNGQAQIDPRGAWPVDLPAVAVDIEAGSVLAAVAANVCGAPKA